VGAPLAHVAGLPRALGATLGLALAGLRAGLSSLPGLVGGVPGLTAAVSEAVIEAFPGPVWFTAWLLGSLFPSLMFHLVVEGVGWFESLRRELRRAGHSSYRQGELLAAVGGAVTMVNWVPEAVWARVEAVWARVCAEAAVPRPTAAMQARRWGRASLRALAIGGQWFVAGLRYLAFGAPRCPRKPQAHLTQPGRLPGASASGPRRPHSAHLASDLEAFGAGVGGAFAVPFLVLSFSARLLLMGAACALL